MLAMSHAPKQGAQLSDDVNNKALSLALRCPHPSLLALTQCPRPLATLLEAEISALKRSRLKLRGGGKLLFANIK